MGQIAFWCPGCGKLLDIERGPPTIVTCKECGYSKEIDTKGARVTITTGVDPVNAMLLKMFGPEGFSQLQQELGRTVQQFSSSPGAALQFSQSLSEINESLKVLARMPDEIKELRSTMGETNKCLQTLSEKL